MGIPVMSMAASLLSTYSSTAASKHYTYIFTALLGIILAFSILLKISNTSLKFEKRQRRIPLPPGPTPWPILGNLPEMFTSRPTFRWLHRLLEEMGTNIGCVRIGNVHLIPVTCPKIGLEFLKEQDATFASRPKTMASRIFSRNYLTVIFPPNGEQWKKMRKVMMSEILSSARHKWMHDKRMEEADNLVKYVYHQTLRGTVDVRSATRHFAANVIRKMVFNMRHFGEATVDGSPGAAEEEHVAAIFLSLKYFYSFCISDYYPFLEGLDIDGHEKYVKQAYKMVNKLHDPIIDARIKEWKLDGHKEPQDLLDIMISLKHPNGNRLLSSEEIKAQTAELMIAAMDNPSNAVEWALAEMINEPELLKKAVEELDKVVGRERLVQESDIPQLNFVKACAREAFRLHPIAPFTPPHVAMKDAVVAGYFIPEGSHVILSRMGLGRNPDVWKDPLKFDPQRHLTSDCTEVVLTEQNLRFISFSTGRRGCVAATLGTSMTVMLLARLLQGFTWNPSAGVEKVDLNENVDDLFMAKPLMATAEPRLPVHLYQAAI